MSLAGLEENVAQDMHVMCNGGAPSTAASLPATSIMAWSTSNTGSSGRATRSTTRWRRNWASTRSPSTPRGRPGAEDRHRPARRSDGHDAFDRMEAEDAAREVVCGRDDLGGYWPGRGTGDAAATGAGAERHRVGRRAEAAACGLPGRAAAGDVLGHRPELSRQRRPHDPPYAENWETITDAMAAVTSRGPPRGASGRHRLRRQDRHRTTGKPQHRRQTTCDRKRARQRLVCRHGPAPQSRYCRCCAVRAWRLGRRSRRSPRRAGHQRIRDQAAPA